MPEVRRQERGRRRIEQILRAAAEVFADRGYEGATTNAIAAAADISPGSLYQYFRNKDEVAAALAEFYRDQLVRFRGELPGAGSGTGRDLDELLTELLGPLVEFNLAHPGFKALFARTDMPPTLRAAVAPAHQAIHRQAAALIGSVLPELGEDTEQATTVAVQLVRGMMPLIVDAEPAARPAMVSELRTVLHAYLTARAHR